MTSNPKRSGLVWNKPKKSTYDALCGAFIVEVSDIGQPYGYQNKYAYTADDVGHVKFERVGNGGDVAFLKRYNALFGPFTIEYERATMINELAMARATVDGCRAGVSDRVSMGFGFDGACAVIGA